MRIHYLQHVPFETPEQISVWAKEKGHKLTGNLLYENDCFPPFSEFDMLVILGGPMGTYDEEAFPWLVLEKQFIKEAIRQRKLVLGICLGAQLIAEVIGGKVYKNQYKEIGWFPVRLTEGAKHSIFFNLLPEEYMAFHWHADTFELPAQAVKVAFSKGCANQAYEYGNHVIGLQFHLECSDSSIRNLVEYSADDMEQGLYVQHPDDMYGRTGHLTQSNAVLFTLLDAMERKHSN